MSEQPPYGVIWEQIDRGEVIPFLGAGASLCARPNDVEGHPIEWTGADDAFLPSGAELGHWLAMKCNFPEPAEDDLAKIASFYEIRARRLLLRRSLHDVFAKDYPICAIHKFLAASPKPLLIVTTNYDDLIEKAFLANHREYHLVTHPERDAYAASVLWWKPNAVEPVKCVPSKLPLSLTDTSIIYKMHGSVSHRPARDSFVITEEDYVRFLARMTQRQAIPARFMMKFESSSFLFLGYGLRDWNLRVMLENLRSVTHEADPADSKSIAGAAGADEEDLFDDLLSHIPHERSELPSWAIQSGSSLLERTLWSHRRIEIFDMDLTEFVASMCTSRSGKGFLPPTDVSSSAGHA